MWALCSITTHYVGFDTTGEITTQQLVLLASLRTPQHVCTISSSLCSISLETTVKT